MRVRGDWNLSDGAVDHVRVAFLTFRPNSTDLDSPSTSLRLLALSHQICQFGVPAIFLEKPPGYYPTPPAPCPLVVAFDLHSDLAECPLPAFFAEAEWLWDVREYFADEVLEDCQHAAVLLMLHRCLDMRPLYFTSFLVLDDCDGPVILTVVPVRVGGSFLFRTLAYSRVPMHIGMKAAPPRDSFVLVPPHQHAFQVRQVSGDAMTVCSITRDQHSFSVAESQFVMLLKPTDFLSRLFNCHRATQTCGMLPDCFQIKFSAADLPLVSREAESARVLARLKGSNGLVSVFEEPSPGIEEILTEQVPDQKVRAKIRHAISPRPLLPSPRVSLSFFESTTLHCFSFDFVDSRPPAWPSHLVTQSGFEGRRLGIPALLVRRNEGPHSVAATSAISQWDKEHFAPISGPKPAHYVVLAESSLPRLLVQLFVRSIAHFYSRLEFGELRPLTRRDTFTFCLPEDVRRGVQFFQRDNRLAEFQQHPVIIFALSDIAFGADSRPRAHVCQLPTSLIQRMDSTEIQCICFQLYAQLRSYFSIGCNKPILEAIYLGFRYQPPFILRRAHDDRLNVHVAWDPTSGISIWTDDIGSTLSEIQLKNPSEFDRYITSLRLGLEGVYVQISVGILGDAVSETHLPGLIQAQIGAFVVSVMPAGAVQVARDLGFENDVFILAHVEYASAAPPPGPSPVAAGTIVSRAHAAYAVALYSNPRRDLADDDALAWIAQEFSNLSWTSVRPGAETRTVAIPPHFAALMKAIRFPTLPYLRLEFI
jgi:hypothetical protein